jgi:serine/threonine-protein kinase
MSHEQDALRAEIRSLEAKLHLLKQALGEREPPAPLLRQHSAPLGSGDFAAELSFADVDSADSFERDLSDEQPTIRQASDADELPATKAELGARSPRTPGAGGTGRSHGGGRGIDLAPGLELKAVGSTATSFAERYDLGDLLGQGGMGEVRLGFDRAIGRSVAIKSLKPEAEDQRLRARFLFEARVQGQLEHPSIVPVYDLGVRSDGSAYFTMRRVKGRTLHEVLKGLRAGDPEIRRSFSRRRLLSALASVCLAVELAHRRGVVHRDLKPTNVMLGSYGEVSVLDWGIARLVRDRAVSSESSEARALHEARSGEVTVIGEMLGTPGYMAPEQIEDPQAADARSDVFSLGAILFEILALAPLIPGRGNAAVLQSTLGKTYDPSPAKRHPERDVPPELDAICIRAAAADRSVRYASARELADAIERHLEGDQDVSRRRSMANKHTRAAIGALADSVEKEDPAAAKEARATAIREVNRALALDPGNPTALRTMARIVGELPKSVAPEVDSEATQAAAESKRRAAYRGAWGYLNVAVHFAVMSVLGLRNLAVVAATSACFLAAAAVAFVASRSRTPGRQLEWALVLLSCAGIALGTGILGPLLLVPGICIANVVVLGAVLERRERWFAIGLGLVALLGPLVAEWIGWLPAPWSFVGGELHILPAAVGLPEAWTLVMLMLSTVGTVVFPVTILGTERDARTAAERHLIHYARHLAEFAPPEARAPSRPDA